MILHEEKASETFCNGDGWVLLRPFFLILFFPTKRNVREKQKSNDMCPDNQQYLVYPQLYKHISFHTH
jgi:hypothetical protein